MNLLLQFNGIGCGPHRMLFYGLAMAVTVGLFIALDSVGTPSWRGRKR